MGGKAENDMRHALHCADSTVYIVDDDAGVCEALSTVLEAEGFKTRCFQTGSAFLASAHPGMRGCLLLDLCMPDCTGLEIQKTLAQHEVQIPVVFLTGYGTLPTSSEAFRAGALDFLQKPVEHDLLVTRVAEAISMDAKHSAHGLQALSVRQRYAHLSGREREVLRFVVNGLSTKEMAREMGLSHRTVDTHRAHLMRKMGCSNLLQLMKEIGPLLEEQGFLE